MAQFLTARENMSHTINIQPSLLTSLASTIVEVFTKCESTIIVSSAAGGNFFHLYMISVIISSNTYEYRYLYEKCGHIWYGTFLKYVKGRR